MPFTIVNETKFYYELHGKGHPLVLIAGYTCDHLFWLPVLSELSQHFQILIFDNHGIGQTTDNGRPLTAEIMAKDIVALAKALNLENPHVLGHSMGGTIAQSIASQFPDFTNKLCLLNTAAKWRSAVILGFKSLLMLRQQDTDFDTYADAVIAWIFGESFIQNKENIRLLKQYFLENPYPMSIKDQIRQFNVLENFDGTNQLENIKSSTLIGYSTQDLVSLPMESRFIAERITKSKLIEFPSAHGTVSEAPQQLTEALLNFF